MATRKRTKKSQVKHVLVRGSRKDPVVMATARRKGSLSRMAKFLKSHFRGANVRIERVRVK